MNFVLGLSLLAATSIIHLFDDTHDRGPVVRVRPDFALGFSSRPLAVCEVAGFLC